MQGIISRMLGIRPRLVNGNGEQGGGEDADSEFGKELGQTIHTGKFITFGRAIRAWGAFGGKTPNHPVRIGCFFWRRMS